MINVLNRCHVIHAIEIKDIHRVYIFIPKIVKHVKKGYNMFKVVPLRRICTYPIIDRSDWDGFNHSHHNEF